MPPPLFSSGFSFLQRLVALAILFSVELLIITIPLDNQSLIARGGVIGFAGQYGAWLVKGIVGYAALFLTFVYLRNKSAVISISRQVLWAAIDLRLMVCHFGATAVFAVLAWICYASNLAPAVIQLSAGLWFLSGCAGIALGAFALVPPACWFRVVRETGGLWWYTLAGIIAACIAGNYLRYLWGPATELTFAIVKTLISPFVNQVISIPATKTLGTPAFSVEIAEQCSGLEGVGLVLAFASVWLWLFRKEARFPQALLLLPAGICAIFGLNAARIATLILIGNAGAEQIALGGFHSQAGWISFNVVALGISVSAQRLRWISNEPRLESKSLPLLRGNPTAVYLLPFLSILAAGMLSTAASGDFEWLYPLRLAASAVALWTLRKHYLGLGWRFGWQGPLTGAIVFGLWLGVDLLVRGQHADTMPKALSAAAPQVRFVWTVLRATAAIITVPIAEELAFRGFLLRRVVSPDFEAVPLTSYTWLGVAVSSIAFGMLHGSLWQVGIVCGLLFAWVQIRTGRIGEAVAAHATANALLAAYVLIFEQWHLW